MYGNIEEIIKKIVENTDLDESKIKNMIKEKETEFSGLISPEGAAHIVAKELGLNLLERTTKELKIENILSNMNIITLTGKVTRIFKTREFEKDGKKGKVANLVIADETGQLKMSLWNEQVDPIEDGKLVEGNVIEISNGYTKENNMGGCELRLGKNGMLKLSDTDIKVRANETQRMKIKDFTPGSFVEVRGSMVQFFESNPFYYVCSECDSKLIDGKCEKHEKAKPKPILIVNGILDDGSGNIRTVFFREHAEKIIGMTTKEAFKLAAEGKDIKMLREELGRKLGSEFIIKGRTKVNKFFERIELIASDIKEVNPEEETIVILNKFEKK